MERHRAWGYAVGGWRSAALEVGGREQQAGSSRQRTEDSREIGDLGIRKLEN
jgi:hypothetical protein